MASSCSNLPCYLALLPKLPSPTLFPSSFNPSTSGISFNKATRTHAKFGMFEGQENNEDGTTQSISLESQTQGSQEDDQEEEDDSCLPSDLEGAVRQSGEATATFTSSGGMRAIVELLIPQLQFLDDEGAQAELWELSRLFLETLIEGTGNQRVKAIFPDAGAAALLKYRWKDATFGFASLGDRKPVQKEDEIVVMVVPDYQMLESVQKIASELSDDPTSYHVESTSGQRGCWCWNQC